MTALWEYLVQTDGMGKGVGSVHNKVKRGRERFLRGDDARRREFAGVSCKCRAAKGRGCLGESSRVERQKGRSEGTIHLQEHPACLRSWLGVQHIQPVPSVVVKHRLSDPFYHYRFILLRILLLASCSLSAPPLPSPAHY